MNRMFLATMTIAVTAITVAACGGGSTKTVKTDDGNVSVNTSKKLPDSFPSDFPVYTGADVQGSVTGTQNGIKGTVVTWQTGDSFDKVKSYYDDAFTNGPWKSTTTGTVSETAYWAAENGAGTKSSYVGVSAGGGSTSIVATVGDKEGGPSAGTTTTTGGNPTDVPDSGISPTSAQLPDAATLPADFPTSRVPIPSGARVTQATSASAGGKRNYVVELYVKDSPANVASNFRSELSKHDWTEVLSSQASGQYFLTVSGANEEGVTVTVTQSDVPGYAQVSLVVIVSG